MKFGLMVARTMSNRKTDGIKNIGDYIQNLAAIQYLPCVDEYLDRENINEGEEKIKVIMNGWYMWFPEFFPPEKRVIPLPISMHISPAVYEKMMENKETIAWFKNNQPIGARDLETMELLKNNGIDSYFSGCLTLTLGKCYHDDNKNDEIIFVDPYLSNFKKELSFTQRMKVILHCILNLNTFFSVFKKFNHKNCYDSNIFVRAGYTGVFLKTYSDFFSNNELKSAHYISHCVKVGKGTNLNSEQEKLQYASELIKKYAKAKLVVTSRIHCALPCLGIETPVLFVKGDAIADHSPIVDAGRFGGIIDFFNVANCCGLNLKCDFSITNLKNKNDYVKYAQKLNDQCEAFIREEL